MNTIKKEYSCCAIFVSYNPEDSIIDNVNQLVNQVAEILIIDNNSGEDSKKYLSQLDENQKITIIYNQDNLGIATALNQGVNYAIQHGYEWLLTFDQDSLAPLNYLEIMMHTYNNCDDKSSVAMIVPNYSILNKKISSSSIDYKDDYAFVKSAMTSGSLIKMIIFKETGLFNDYLFIDYVDHEFCLRCRRAGFKILESKNAVIVHILGYPVEYNLMGKKIIVTNHSPLRRFYKYRNKLIIYFHYCTFDPFWIMRDVRSSIYEIFIILFLEKNRLSKLSSVLNGLQHGLKKLSSLKEEKQNEKS